MLACSIMEPEIGVADAAIAAFEESVRAALEAFLSGPRPVRPLSRRRAGWHPVASLVPDLRRAAGALRSAGLGEERALVGFEKALVAVEARGREAGDRQMAELTAAGYRLLDTLQEERRALAIDGGRTALAAAEEYRIAPRCIDPNDYRDRYLRPVSGLHAFAERAMKPFVAGLYLHGSLATLDFACDYSDFDTLVVVRREVVRDSERLLRFLPVYRRSMCFLFEFDPLQHHAHILLTEIDLESYSDTLFPLEVLDHARSLGGEWEPLRVRRRNSGADSPPGVRACLRGIRPAGRGGLSAGQPVRFEELPF